MKVFSQKDAVVNVCIEFVQEKYNIEFEMNGEATMKSLLTPEDKKEIRSIIFEMSRNNEIAYKESFDLANKTDVQLNKYVSGLVDNHIRKTKEFNNGDVYKIKNPGSRAHQSDDQLKNLKILSGQYQDNPEALAEITQAILDRKAVIAASKAKTVTINIDKLPEHLRKFAQPAE